LSTWQEPIEPHTQYNINAEWVNGTYGSTIMTTEFLNTQGVL